MGRFGFGGFGNIAAKANAASKAAASKAQAAITSAKEATNAREFELESDMQSKMQERITDASVAASKKIENAQFSEEWASVMKSLD